jgi:hypothetical protein
MSDVLECGPALACLPPISRSQEWTLTSRDGEPTQRSVVWSCARRSRAYLPLSVLVMDKPGVHVLLAAVVRPQAREWGTPSLVLVPTGERVVIKVSRHGHLHDNPADLRLPPARRAAASGPSRGPLAWLTPLGPPH